MTTTPDPARIDWAAAIPTNRKPPPAEGILERLERQHQERATRRLAQLALDDVPARYADAVPDHPQVRAWLDGLLAREHTDGLTLLGGVGRGKTHEAFGAYRFALMGGVVPGAWLHVPTWLESQRPNRTAAAEHSGSPARARLLVVDDLGAERGSEWTVEAVYRLIDSRWRQALPTLVTSNLVPDQLRQLLGDRVVSRLAGMGPTVVLDGPEYPDRRRAARVMDTPPS